MTFKIETKKKLWTTQRNKKKIRAGAFRGAERRGQVVRQLRLLGRKEGSRATSLRTTDGAPDEPGQVGQASPSAGAQLRRGNGWWPKAQAKAQAKA